MTTRRKKSMPKPRTRGPRPEVLKLVIDPRLGFDALVRVRPKPAPDEKRGCK